MVASNVNTCEAGVDAIPTFVANARRIKRSGGHVSAWIHPFNERRSDLWCFPCVPATPEPEDPSNKSPFVIPANADIHFGVKRRVTLNHGQMKALVEYVASWICAGLLVQTFPEACAVRTTSLGSIRQRRHAQSRISVDLPNRLSIRSTASSAVTLLVSITGLSSMMSSEAMRPLSAIISITSCASR